MVKFLSTKIRKLLLKRRWKTALLSVFLLSLSVTLFSPIKIVKGLLVDTGLAAGSQQISMDSGRVSWVDAPSGGFGHNIVVYDISSGTSASFAGPNGVPGGDILGGAIYGDQIVAAGNPTALLYPYTATTSYCIPPHALPLPPSRPSKLPP